MNYIRLQGLRKTFGDGTVAVKNLDLELGKGEMVVLLGPSGCGKTTTLRMIAGLESSDQGQVIIDDQDVTKKRPAARDVGFVFQFYALYPRLSVAENIAFPLHNRPTALAGMAVGVSCLFQPWWQPGVRVGFFVLMFSTVVYIVTSHLLGQGES